jgi:hypothetical protein
LSYTIEEIEKYLRAVRKAVNERNYRIELNKNRADNLALFEKYILDEKKAESIMLNLEPIDFIDAVKNSHKGFEHEMLYIFGKRIKLLERFGSREVEVELYIKFNHLENNFLIVVSFHEKKYPLKYYFK